MTKHILLGTSALCCALIWAVETNSTNIPESKEKGVEYLRSINERSAKIVTTLQISEAGKSNRVLQILVEQYRGLNDIQFVRDVEIGNAKAKFADDKTAANAAIQKARD